MKTMIAILFALIFSTYSYAEKLKFGARSVALGGASVSLVDIWASYNNQAALAKINNIQCAAFYINNFSIKELSTKAVSCLLPSKYGNFNINISQFGYSKYNETKIGFSYSKVLLKKLAFGIQFDRLAIKQTGISGGSIDAYTFEIGLLSNIKDNILIGFHIFNPIQAKFSSENYNKNIDSIAKLGFSWKIDKYFLITTQSQLMFNKSLKHGLGLEYYINKTFTFRCGISNKPKSISIGAAYKYKKISCNIAFWHHQTLGYSPSADIIFSL